MWRVLFFILLAAAFVLATGGCGWDKCERHHGHGDRDDDVADDDDNDDASPADDGLQWIAVAGGSFAMGCSPGDADCAADETRHPATVSSFSITATPITQTQYGMQTGVNPSYFTGCDACPVEQVAWADAAAFCQAVGGRLPTEAEWEFTARGKTTTRTYCGDDLSCLTAVAWYRDNANMKTHPVAGKRANAFGLYDMLGDVWEWVNDWYDPNYYQNAPTVDPTGPTTGFDRVLRGGAWNNDATWLRVSKRNHDQPNDSNRAAGFRCVRPQ